MKIQKKEQIEQSTELVTMGTMLPVAANELMGASSPDSRLPTIKIINSIEVDPARGITKDMSGMLVLQAGDATTIVPKGSIITVIAARDAVRRLDVEIDGVSVAYDSKDPAHSKLDKSYTRAYKALGQFKSTHDQFIEGLKQGWQKGSTYLVALLVEGGCAIAELPAFKTQASYWYRPLAQAVLHPSRQAISITDNDHTNNLKASKADSSHKYFDPSKHSQWSVVELTDDQLKSIVEAVRLAKTDIDGWFAR